MIDELSAAVRCVCPHGKRSNLVAIAVFLMPQLSLSSSFDISLVIDINLNPKSCDCLHYTLCSAEKKAYSLSLSNMFELFCVQR
jgi:hypothetical protein